MSDPRKHSHYSRRDFLNLISTLGGAAALASFLQACSQAGIDPTSISSPQIAQSTIPPTVQPEPIKTNTEDEIMSLESESTQTDSLSEEPGRDQTVISRQHGKIDQSPAGVQRAPENARRGHRADGKADQSKSLEKLEHRSASLSMRRDGNGTVIFSDRLADHDTLPSRQRQPGPASMF